MNLQAQVYVYWQVKHLSSAAVYFLSQMIKELQKI